MKIIIEIKDTATLSRIDSFDRQLKRLLVVGSNLEQDYNDVIAGISKEW